MRREQVLKVCANHFLTPELELQPMSDRAWLWAANDFADEELREERLCAKFKTREQAIAFRDAFDKAKQGQEGATTPIEPPRYYTAFCLPSICNQLIY